MKVCIRCNPVSELHETAEGLRCRVHGDQYVIEEQPDPVPADAYLPAETHAPDPVPADAYLPAETHEEQ